MHAACGMENAQDGDFDYSTNCSWTVIGNVPFMQECDRKCQSGDKFVGCVYGPFLGNNCFGVREKVPGGCDAPSIFASTPGRYKRWRLCRPGFGAPFT
jgi:hypothetical protein